MSSELRFMSNVLSSRAQVRNAATSCKAEAITTERSLPSKQSASQSQSFTFAISNCLRSETESMRLPSPLGFLSFSLLWFNVISRLPCCPCVFPLQASSVLTSHPFRCLAPLSLASSHFSWLSASSASSSQPSIVDIPPAYPYFPSQRINDVTCNID